MAIAKTGKSINRAATILQAEGVVAIPTETVYGLAGNIFSRKAIAKIYSIKKRPRTNPLIVHVASIDMVRELVASFPQPALKLAKKFWPGPLTIILPKSRNVGHWLTANTDTVGIRMPDHPHALQLISRCGFPLAAPSANPFKYISPVTAKQVEKMLGAKVDYILDGGRCSKGIESTIVAFEGTKAVILRAGAISEEQITKTLGSSLLKRSAKKTAHPGMFKKHYSPHTSLMLVDDVLSAVKNIKEKKVAILSFKKKYRLPDGLKQVQLSKKGDMYEAAANLYNALHQLDNGSYDVIIAERVPEKGLGKAINERLQKAAVS